MKTIHIAIAMILLIILMGCDKRDDQDKWVNLAGFNFPVNVSHFADYDSTDYQGNLFGKVQYGSGGDNNDWKVFEYNGKGSIAPDLITGLSAFDYGNYQSASHTSSRLAQQTGSSKNHDAHGFIHPGVPETIVPDSVHMGMSFIFKTPSLLEVSTTPVIEYQVFPIVPENAPFMYSYFGINLFTESQTDHTQLSVTVPVGYWEAYAFYDNTWHDAAPFDPLYGPGDLSWDDVSFSDTVQVIFSLLEPPPQPTFSAEVTNDYHVKLNWITYHEYQVQGYNILRSESSSIQTATVINDSLIPFQEPSTESHTYTFMDENVNLNQTYYYWLQIVNLDYESLCGPRQVTVIYTGDNPSENKVYPAYPNSCTEWITLPYSITDSARVTIVLLNTDNQVVLSWQNNYASGSHEVQFNLGDFPVGLYRVFYWIKMTNKSYYSYGDVLKVSSRK